MPTELHLCNDKVREWEQIMRTYPKGESVKPSIRELERIEADYDPSKEYDSPRIEYLVARMERPHR